MADIRSDLHHAMTPHIILPASSVYRMMNSMLVNRLNFLVTQSATSIGRDYHLAKKQHVALVFLAKETYAAKSLMRELYLYPGMKLTKKQSLDLYLCIKDAIDAFKDNLNLNDYDFSKVDDALESWFTSGLELGILMTLMEKAFSACFSLGC